MKRSGMLAMVALLLGGASPAPDYTPRPAPQIPSFTAQAPALVVAPPGYTTAPTPNDDSGPPNARASKDASLAPGFFSRRDQYRGEGLSPGSSAQIEQDRRAKPGAGFNLRMPLQ